MRRFLMCALAALCGCVPAARAGDLCCCSWLKWCQPHCMVPPPPPCPDCCGPCERRCCLTPFGPEHAQKYLDCLPNGTCCERIKAIHKLGSRLHVDLCQTPCAAAALIAALLTDPCWEARREAAGSLLWQQVPSEPILLALHVSSKLDPHFMVRAKAAEALDVLTVCRKPCYAALFEAGDALVKELRAKKVVPGTPAMPPLLAPLAVGTTSEPAQAALPEATPGVQAAR